MVIIANKWDLVKDRGPKFVETFDDEVRRRMKFLEYAPILHISALTGERAPRVLETIDLVSASRRKRVPTPALNKFLAEVTAANPPVSPGRQHVRILYAAQIGIAPPSFVFFTNVATTFHFSYERFLVNQLREHFEFTGTPIRVQVRRRSKRGPPIGVVESSAALLYFSGRWPTYRSRSRFPSARSSRRRRCAISSRCSRTSCVRGRASFPGWAWRKRLADRASTAAAISSR